jgi:hypothetical protein
VKAMQTVGSSMDLSWTRIIYLHTKNMPFMGHSCMVVCDIYTPVAGVLCPPK